MQPQNNNNHQHNHHRHPISPKEIEQRLEQMRSVRVLMEPLYDDVNKYILDRPKTMRDNTHMSQQSGNVGDVVRNNYSRYGVQAAIRFASGLQGLIAPPEQRWLSLQVTSPTTNDLYQVRSYLDNVEEQLYSLLSSSGFYHKSLEMITEYAAYGQGVLLVEYDPVNTLRFSSIPMRECYIDVDINSQINTLARCFTTRVRNLPSRFPDLFNQHSPDQQRFNEMLHHRPNDEVEVTHFVCPNDQYVPNSPSRKKRKYHSVYSVSNVPTGSVIAESHFYDSFPYLVPRWQLMPGEIYGRSQGMTALPDIRRLSEISRDAYRGLRKLTDPPLLANEGAFQYGNGINYGNGGLTMVSPVGGSVANAITPLVTNSRPDIGMQFIQKIEQEIDRAFFSDLLAEDKNAEMTATEANTRQMLRIANMAPQIGRIVPDYLDPLIERCLSIMLKHGVIEPPPEPLSGLTIEYRSPLAVAQRRQSLENVGSFMQYVQMAAQVDPSAMDAIQGDNLIKYAAIASDVPTNILRSPDEIAEVRSQRAQQEQQVQNAQVNQTNASAALDAARTADLLSSGDVA